MTNDSQNTIDDHEELRKEMEAVLSGGYGPKIARVILSVLGGVPGVGLVTSGVASGWSEYGQDRFQKTFKAWFQLIEDELEEIGRTMTEIMMRLDLDNPKVQQRIESTEYLSLIKKAFRDWSAAESEEKRVLIRNLLSNAGAERQLSSDEVIRMFITWIEEYSEAHFAVIRAVYNSTGITRAGIWEKIHGERVREDSADADLYKLLFRDLSTGGVLRQIRPKDAYGNFLKKPRQKRRSSSRTMKSAFDNQDGYELTELGKQFVHYTMNEVVPKITATSEPSDNENTPKTNNV